MFQVNRYARIVKRNAQAGLRKALRPQQPDFIVIGAQKCGTSSLHHYLQQHPSLVGSNPKEIHYFNREVHFSKDIQWYQSHFKSLKAKEKLFFESTPAYIYQPGTAQLLSKTYPTIKLIALLRDPVKRAYSAWNFYRDIFDSGMTDRLIRDHNRRQGNHLYRLFFKDRECFPSFRECIELELPYIQDTGIYEPALLRRGLYFRQLEEFWKYFNKDQLLIVGFSDFIDNFEESMDRITNFLGAKGMDWSRADQTVKNAKPYNEPIKPDDKAFLERFYEDPNDRLFDAIGPINW